MLKYPISLTLKPIFWGTDWGTNQVNLPLLSLTILNYYNV